MEAAEISASVTNKERMDFVLPGRRFPASLNMVSSTERVVETKKKPLNIELI